MFFTFIEFSFQMLSHLHHFTQVCICISLIIPQALIIIFLGFSAVFVAVLFTSLKVFEVYYCSFKLYVIKFILVFPIREHFYRNSGFDGRHTILTIHTDFHFVIWPGNMELFLSLCVYCVRLDQRKKCPTWLRTGKESSWGVYLDHGKTVFKSC